MRILVLLLFGSLVSANQPPRFELTDVSGGAEIVLKLKEGPSTPVGSVIYRIRASDADGDVLQFGLQGQAANELLRIKPVGDNEADLELIKELDRETVEEYELVITLTDGRIGAGQAIKQSLLIVVEDMNDNSPVFAPFPQTLLLKENAPPAVILTVEATDRDQGVYGQVVYSLEGDDAEEGLPFSITTVGGKGILRSLEALDYETRSWYQLRILARDQGPEGRINTATAGLLVRLVDEEDQGPEFITVPSITRIPEDAQPGTSVLRVKAIDGDRGVNQRIVYSIQGGSQEYFAIDPKDGIVYLVQELDREDPSVVNGALILTIRAEEDSPLRPSVTTEVTVLILDVNDQAPAFRGQQYVAEIDENSPSNMPVTFVGPGSLPEVYDFDQGRNGTFHLSLECLHDLFDISPNVVVNEAVFSIRVKNHLALDYEKLNGTECTITAKEVVSKGAKSTSVPILIRIRDVNDNIPQFSRPSYQVQVKENAPVGTVIGTVEATDEDSGELGTDGIRYSLLAGSSMAQALVIDPVSGAITIGPGSSGVLDREKVSQLIVMVEARDSLGTGNRNTVQFSLELQDENDNPPVFIQSHFEIYINENESTFPYRFRVEAFDRDLNGSANGLIRYSIMDGDAQGNFTIDSTTGEIGVVHPLDFELLSPSILDSKGLGHVRPINLTVRASDMGDPPLFTDTHVIIFVHDVNDYPPVFSKPAYSLTVPEDVAPGSSILQVEALDQDGSAPNNVLAYRIQSGARDKFVIDSVTGVISIASGASLDPDQSLPRVSRYQLEILVLDGGVGRSQLTATANVVVSISDVNNKAPILVDPGTVRIEENVPAGVVLSQIVADDPDERPSLRFWIDHAASEGRNENGLVVRDQNVTSWFEINTRDGRIRVVHQLDREKAESIRLAIRVEDLAASTAGQTASGTLTVLVDDINDHDPVFNQPFYRRSVPENSKRGSAILTLSADDADLNRTISYTLDGPMELLELVHLNGETGEIVVSGKIDRERFSWINLTARASDSGTPRRSSFVPVLIQVLDENDNNPQFAQSIGNFSVRENVPPGTVIGTAVALDADVGDFGQVTYLMDRRSSKGRFSIDPETGTIVVTERLDREEQESYTLIVEAWDNYRVGYAAGESRNAFQQVTVLVTDENDEAPVFEIRSGCVEITEFHDSRVPVTTIHATDADDPATPNGHIVFSIDDGNDLGLFGLTSAEATSAKLMAVKPLVGHYGNYTLKLRAQDRGTPANAAYQDVQVCVSDFNDHAPVFVRPELNNTAFRVFENTTVGSVITTLLATDEDAGLNSQVRYSIRPVGHHWKWFQVDNVTGDLTLAQPLDREKQKVLQIRVEARDSGVPTWLSADLDLTISVRDVNDHPAHFPMDAFQINVTEHDPVKQPIKLPDTVDQDEPDDPSSPGSNPVCYFIVGGNSQGVFSLDPVQHTLKVEKELDREDQAVHIIVVQASERCDQIPPMTDFFDPADDSLLKVTVNVNDINDNPPVFVRKVFTGGITTETDFGAEVLKVSATDRDTERNARLHYYLRQRVQSTLFNPDSDVVLANPFVIDRETGVISLNFDPQPDMKGYFDLEVRVNDSGTYEDTARVFIYLLRQDQRVKFVLRQHPQYLRTRIEQFREVLGNITKSIVNVDELKAHSNGNGQVDKTKTDVYMHFVNPADNSVLEVEAVLRMIDGNVETLDQLFKDFNVLDTSAAEPSGSRGGNTLASAPQHFSLLWAGGTAVFLAMILFLVLGLCVSQRLVLMRKLKAASATAFGSQSNVTRTAAQVPNTNQHTVEGSNPVWRRELEADWYKHEDIYRSGESDGLDSLDVNAILGNAAPSTSRHSSAANTASLKSSAATTEAFNRGMLQRNVLSLRSNGGSMDDTTLSEKECEIGEVREGEGTTGRRGGLYQRNVYHFGYPVFQPVDKSSGSTTTTASSSGSTTFLTPRKLETTEL